MPRRGLLPTLALLALALLGLPAAPQRTAAAPKPAQAIVVAIEAPDANAVVGDKVTVNARVTSPLELTSVVAAGGGRTISMSRYPGDLNLFGGQLDLSGLGYGPVAVTVTARDAVGNSAQATRSFVHDGPPTLTIVGPADQEVANPELAVRLSCADDSPTGCAETGIYRYIDRFQRPAPLLTGTVGISGVISLANIAQPTAELVLQGRDSINNYARQGRTSLIFIDRSPNSAEALKVRGQIVDADATRVLVNRYDETMPVSGISGYYRPTESFVVVDRATGKETVIVDNPGGGPPLTGRLAPSGLLYTKSYATGDYDLIEWRNGITTTLEIIRGGIVLIRHAGDYTAWIKNNRAFRRDTAAGQTQTIFEQDPAGPSITPYSDNIAVAANGDVIYALDDGSVKLYRGGQTTTLADGAAFTGGDLRGDGTNMTYVRCDKATPANCELILVTGEGQRGLGRPPEYYQINNGWVAFTRQNSTGLTKIWRRWPDGREEQISLLNSSEELGQIGPDGTIVFNDNQFISRPGQPPVQISTNELSRVYLRPGVVERSLGRVLFTAQSHRVSLPLLSR